MGSRRGEPRAFVLPEYRMPIYTYLEMPLQNDKVSEYMTKFIRSSSHPYTVITPSTPLAELEQFLGDKLFALGARSVS